MNALVVPGVRVEARFDVLPPLPAGSGVVGIAAIVDRPPSPASLIGITKTAEIAGAVGPGTVASAPEIVANWRHRHDNMQIVAALLYVIRPHCVL